MLRGNDVPTMMLRVETALSKQARSKDHVNPIILQGHGDDEFGIGALRSPAVLVTEFQAGSARPVLGRVVGFIKKVMRRALRWYMVPIAEQQSRFNLALLDVAERIRSSQERLEGEINSLRLEVKAGLAKLDDRVDLVVLDSEQRGTFVGDGSEGSAEMLPSTREHLDYKGFEDRHRGTYDDTKKLLEHYLVHFRGRRRVLDIGCGRGEFLQLMKDNGIDAYGVDLDEGMASVARSRGLDVIVGDAITHLRGLPAGEIDAVFSSQVAEHLKTSELMSMLDLAYRKLEPGGICIFETPNPESLFIFHSFFYVDLTHIKPIHPEALKWAMEAVGFDSVSAERILPVPDEARLASLPEASAMDPALEVVQKNIDRLNAMLYGPQHFYAIGTKPGDSL